MINTVRDLTVGVFGHLEITSKLDIDLMIKYIERIICVSAVKSYRQFLLACKDIDRGCAGNQCTIGSAKNSSMNHFWNWDKAYCCNYEVDTISEVDQCESFDN